jgi:predicted Fe-Mo cluster-binding NifX family protein
VGGSTRLRIVRDAGVVVVIIANISDASYGDLADKIAKLFVD